MPITSQHLFPIVVLLLFGLVFAPYDTVLASAKIAAPKSTQTQTNKKIKRQNVIPAWEATYTQPPLADVAFIFDTEEFKQNVYGGLNLDFFMETYPVELAKHEIPLKTSVDTISKIKKVKALAIIESARKLKLCSMLRSDEEPDESCYSIGGKDVRVGNVDGLLFYFEVGSNVYRTFPTVNMTDIQWIGSPDKEGALFVGKSGVYNLSHGVLARNSSAKSIDLDTFRLKFQSDEYSGNAFYQDSDTLFLFDAGKKRLIEVLGADPDTFREEKIEPYSVVSFYRDDFSAFYFDARHDGYLKQIKGFSFRNDFDFLGWTIYKKGDAVYSFSIVDPEARVFRLPKGAKFELINGSGRVFYTDGRNVYVYVYRALRLEKLKNIDLKTFEILSGDPDKIMFKDRRGVYVADVGDVTYFKKNGTFVKRLQVSEPASFKQLTELHDRGAAVFKDDKNVYTYGNELAVKKGIDQQSVRILADDYGFIVAKDAQGIYTGRDDLKLVVGADAETFEIVRDETPWPYGKDKNNIYYVGRQDKELRRLDGVDPETFRIVGRFNTWYYYAADKDHVWFYDNNEDVVKLVPDVDPLTFDYEGHAKEYFK